MKKKFITAFTVLLLVTNTGLSQAAEKAITQYSNAEAGISNLGPIDPLGGTPPGDPDYTGGMGDPIVSATGAVTATPTTINLGGGIDNAAGAVWYQGDSDLAYCTSGACNIDKGFRAFFNFRFNRLDSTNDSTNSADGFVFAILNASLNTNTSGIPNRTGGAPSQTSMGELMGYAGPGTTTDRLGLRPPKMGIEFDTYPNSNDTDLCHSDSRNDDHPNSSFRNHIALMFWGNDLTGNCTYSGTSYSQISFDDNRHGSGSDANFNPLNSSISTSGYYEGPAKKPGGTYNWMEDGAVHKFRIEIDRSTKTDGSGNGLYTTRAWVDCNGTSCTTDQAIHFQDVVNPFTDTSPQINRTVELSAADHLLMNRILFGFTQATGAETQIATITNFLIYFPHTPPAPPCSYVLSAPDNGATPLGAATGSSGTVTLTAGSLCPWTTSNNGNAWITVTPANGTGTGSPQTITYTASANTGLARNGTITIGGQNFQVYQAAGCSGYRVWNNYDNNGRPFAVVDGSGNKWCNPNRNLDTGDEITDATHLVVSGGRINRYSSSDSNCNDTTPPGNITYATFAAGDTNGDCQVCYSQSGATDCCPGLSIATPTPANGIQGQFYSTTVSASGGSGTLTYSRTNGTLPTGLSLNPSTGEIYGTPSATGTWNNIRVTVTDSCSSGAQTAQTGNFSITINAPPINGTCGTANGGTFTSAPTSNLCSAGSSTSVTGSGPWSWSCTGSNGGTTASCSANIQTWTVTPSAGSNGSINPNTAQTVNHNSTKTFTVTANTGYAATMSGTCGGSPASGTGTFTYTTGAITGACTVSATFAIRTFTLTPSAGTGGTISPASVVTVNYGGSQTFTINANASRRIADVLVDGSSVGAVTSYTFTNVTANHTISATFVFDPYQVYASGNAFGYRVSGGACNTLSSGSSYNLAYGGSVTFYRNTGCSGDTEVVSYNNAVSADTDTDGQVEIYRCGISWLGYPNVCLRNR